MLCYNLGVELYQRKLFAEATSWLRESYELGKDKQNIGHKNQVVIAYPEEKNQIMIIESLEPKQLLIIILLIQQRLSSVFASFQSHQSLYITGEVYHT